MSEGFEHEPFHVPQQSRRDKLRENPTSLQVGCSGLLYDPSTLLNCGPATQNHHHPPLKEDPTNFMGFVGLGTAFFPPSSSSSSSSQLLLDLPQSSINHTFNQEDTNPFLYSSQLTQNFRAFDPSFDNGGGVAFKQQNLSYPPHDMMSTGQGLSLSLSSHYRNRSAGIFDEKGVGNYAARGVSGGGPMTRSSVPTGPFTGYAAILNGSRFLKPAQQLLEEFCNVGRGFYADRNGGESPGSPAGQEMERLSENAIGGDDPIESSSGGERRRMKARLISLLNEVYRRYKQYYQQLQAVITSFESVAGLSTAAPFISLAIKAMSKHFQCLKNAITNQLHGTNKVSEDSLSKEESQSFGLVDQGIRQQIVTHNLSILEQPHIWRPQRGLPERAVAVLRAWLFEHFLHPYPTDADKQLLAKQTGLSRNQVSNWFINARVRLWKPMVEEIHSLEMRQAQKASEGENGNGNGNGNGQYKPPISPVLPMDKEPQSTTSQKNQDPPLKRNRNDLAQLHNNCGESVNFSYENVASHRGGGVGVSLASGNSGISLTLGLHQNNGGGLSEPLPLTAAHFGLEENGSSYAMEGFESQNRRDISGQLLHDFVG